MLKENSPEKWGKLLELQSHHDAGKNDDKFKAEMEGVEKFIPRYTSFVVIEVFLVDIPYSIHL